MRAMMTLIIFCLSTLAQAKDVNLKWKTIDGAKKYNLEISDDASFQNKIFTKTVSQSNLVHDLKGGIYYLRVQGVDPRGKSGTWSAPFKLVVTIPVSPIADTEVPKKLIFVEKKPDVETTWNSPEGASHFKVKVLKDGKEILSQETSSPHLNFKPSGPGDYKVVVSSGIQQYFGPAVTVNTIHVEKKELAAPQWNIPENKKFNSRRPINLAWTSVDTAHFYRIKIFRKPDVGSRDPSNDSPVYSADKLENSQIIIDPLPIGKYFAVVESISDEGAAVTSANIDLEVKRVKPIEFEKFDVSARYNVTPESYTSNIYENGGITNTSSVGGNVEVSGNLWLPDSHWGVRAGGSWGGFTTNGSNVTYNDLQAAAQYRLLPEDNFLRSDIKPFFGARAWTLPLILGPTGGSNSNNTVQIFPLALAGPVIGFELVHAFSEKIAGVVLAQASFPVTNSSIGNQAASTVRADFGTPSYKAEIGAKYALPGTLRLVAMAGYDNEQMQFSPFAGLGASGAPPSGIKDSITLKAPTFSFGIEASDDGPLFRTAGSAQPKSERFSDFDLSMRYAFESFNYFANIIENTSGGSTSANGLSGGEIEFDGKGWFNESHHGIRLAADWAGFTDQGASVNFPEFEIQWALRPVIHPNNRDFNFNNFFGLRSWRIPLIENQGNNNGTPSAASLFFRSPQLLGPAETILLTKGLSETWMIRFMAEVSSPLTITDKDSTIDHVLPNDLSWKSEIQGVKSFTPELSAGVGVGYSVSQMTYAPTTTYNNGSLISGTSYVQMAAPLLSIFGTYSF